MPQISEGWIDSSQLETPLLSLGASEVDGFLDFMFHDVARRPDALLLRETAGVVRYLSLLARRGVPVAAARLETEGLPKYAGSPKRERYSRSRSTVERIAEVLWGRLLQSGQVRPCTKDQALRFLRRQSATYLSGNLDLAPALRIIEDFDILPLERNEPKPFQPGSMMSQSLAAYGTDNPRLRDDLSERIYAAFQALKIADLKDAAQCVADALVRRAVPRRRPESQWTYETVHERVKAYEQRQRKELRKTTGTPPSDVGMGEWRDRLANRWIGAYRYGLDYPVRREVITRHFGWLCSDCDHVMPAVQDAPPPTYCARCSSQKVAVLMAYLTAVRPAGGKEGEPA